MITRPFSSYAASLNQTNAFDTYNLSSSAQQLSSASQTNFELGVMAPCPQGFSLMGWLDGVVICSSAEVGFDHQSLFLVNELEFIQRNSDLSYDEKINALIGVMEVAGPGEVIITHYADETMLLAGSKAKIVKFIAYCALALATMCT